MKSRILQGRGKLYILAMIALVLIILWSFTGEKHSTATTMEATYEVWDEGWTQVLEEDTLVLVNEIPELDHAQILYFYSKDLEVRVYIEEELVYSFEMQDGFEFLKTPGIERNQIEIGTEESGEEIRIELTSQFSNRFATTVTGIYLLDHNEVKDIYLEQNRIYMVMAFILLGVCVMTLVSGFMWKRKEVKKYFLILGVFCLAVLCWVLAMSGMLDMVFHQPIVSYIISMLVVILGPALVYEFILITHNRPSTIVNYIGILTWVNFWLQIILQFGFGISFMEMLPLSYVIYFLGIIGVIYEVVIHIRLCKKVSEINIAFASVLLILIGLLVEIAVIYLFPERSDLLGIAGLTGILLYLMVNMVSFAREESKTDMEKQILKEHYEQLKNTTLIQQIKAHFFFNTLNTISALCKRDVKEADRAIRLFASYMRSYMYLIVEQKNIPFEKEMELVECSLKIEKLRFEDRIECHLDFEYCDFEIPPLSIQLLVENAIVHGLGRTVDNGCVTIETRKVGDRALVIVSDTGVGFDTSILETRESIGLQNMKKRIALMANGTLSIESKIGEGTKATIAIPLS